MDELENVNVVIGDEEHPITLAEITDAAMKEMVPEGVEIQGMYLMGCLFPSTAAIEVDDLNALCNQMVEIIRPHIEKFTGLGVPVACLTMNTLDEAPQDVVPPSDGGTVSYMDGTQN